MADSRDDKVEGGKLTRGQVIAWLLANFESRLWRTANDDYQLRLLSRYEVEALRSALAAIPSAVVALPVGFEFTPSHARPTEPNVLALQVAALRQQFEYYRNNQAHMVDVMTALRAIDLDALHEAASAPSATRCITATQIHEVYQEEFYRKDKTGKVLAHSTHGELIKAVIQRLLGVEITEPWGGSPESTTK